MEQYSVTEVFNQIYEDTKKKTLAYITAKCGNVQDIQDIFQDTYTEIYLILSNKGSDYIQYPDAFVQQIARQKIYRYYKLLDRLKDKFIVTKPNLEEEQDGDLLDLAVDNFQIESWLEEKELKQKVADFLNAKPIDIQKIFRLFYYLEMTIPEIANLMGISESNVKNKIYRTIKEMRKIYQKEEVGIYE